MNWRTGRPALFLLFLALSFAPLGCNNDENCAPYDPNEFLPASLVIKVHESAFTFDASPTVHVGQRVEWQSVITEARTITSGTGADDAHKGEKFNKELLGYCSGSAIGGRFQIVFAQPDTIRFFSTIPSDGVTYRGTVYVVP